MPRFMELAVPRHLMVMDVMEPIPPNQVGD